MRRLQSRAVIRRRTTIAVSLVALLGVAGTAIALWSASGSGSGQAKAVEAVEITVTAAAGDADLYPGFTEGDLYFTLTNDNPYDVEFDAMTAGSVTSSDEISCPASNVSVANASGLLLSVAAESTSSTLSIEDVVSMSSGAPNGCQGVTFTVQLTLSGSQV